LLNRSGRGDRVFVAEIGDLTERLPFIPANLDHQGLLVDEPLFERVDQLVERHHPHIVRTYIHIPAIFGFRHSG
jgi:hypothetical protein